MANPRIVLGAIPLLTMTKIPSHLSPPFLGRWCLPLGKWTQTCQPDVKGRFADTDNSVWQKGPLNADGEEVYPDEYESSQPANRQAVEEQKKDNRDQEDARGLFARVLTSYHG